MKFSYFPLIAVTVLLFTFSCKSRKENEGRETIKKGQVTVEYAIAAESGTGNISMLRNKLTEYRLNLISHYMYGMSFTKTNNEVKLLNSGVTLSGSDYKLEDQEITRSGSKVMIERGKLTYMLDIGSGTYESYEATLEGPRFKTVYSQLLVKAVKESELTEGRIYAIDDVILQEKGDSLIVTAKFIIISN